MEGPPVFPSNPTLRHRDSKQVTRGRVRIWAQQELRLQVNHGGRPRPALQGPLHPCHQPPKQQVFARSGFLRFLFQPAQTSPPQQRS